MTNTELIKKETAGISLASNGAVELHNMSEAFGFASLMQAANMLPKGTTVEGAVVAFVAGAALGLNPFQAVQGIAVINGRPAIWGDAMTAIVKASGLLEDEKIEYLPSYKDCKGVRVIVKRKGVATPYEGLFSEADATRAGLWNKGTWASYPQRMLLNRARAFAYRDAFSDILKGMRSAEEEQDIIIEATAAPVSTPAPRKRRASASAIIEAEEEVSVPVEEVPQPAPEASVEPAQEAESAIPMFN